MDRLSFRKTKSKEIYQNGKHTESVEIILNGTPLLDIVKECEHKALADAGKEFDYLQVGNYVYLHPRNLYEEFLNPFHKGIYPDKNLVEVLACSCGSIGCWSLLANVEHTMTEVIWNGFISPICEHVENLKVTFPTFKFSKGHYRSAIAQLKDISGISGELPKEVGFPEFAEPACMSDRISKLRKKAKHAWNEKLVVHDEIWRSTDLFLETAKK